MALERDALQLAQAERELEQVRALAAAALGAGLGARIAAGGVVGGQ